MQPIPYVSRFSQQHNSIRIIFMSLFLGLVSAFSSSWRIHLPGNPIPIVPQPFFAFFSGSALGPWVGLISQLAYLAIYPLVIPSLGGWSHLIDGRAGYLWGMVLAAWCAGMLRRILPLRTHAGIFLFFLFIILVTTIYLPGTLYLAYLQQWPLSTLFLTGILPFLYGDTIKILAVYFLLKRTISHNDTHEK